MISLAENWQVSFSNLMFSASMYAYKNDNWKNKKESISQWDQSTCWQHNTNILECVFSS